MIKQKDFLVELGTEELPPKALAKLSDSFADNLKQSLKKAALSFDSIDQFATPRRLAVKVNGLQLQQADKSIERKGPAVKAAFKEDGCPTPAAEGFARSCGVSVDALEKAETDKGDWLVFRSTLKGAETKTLLPAMVTEALSKLPIPKRMRWGNRQAQFVRPVHWLLMLLGNDVVKCNIMEHEAGRSTKGHRFHHPDNIDIPNPADYESLLETEGHIIPDFSKRLTAIKAQVEQAALKVNGTAVIDPDLLNEVTGLVEWPLAVLGNFDKKFLEIPAEALISAMKGHQKYFHIIKDNKLLPSFITVSNINSSNIQTVQQGNERVIRPRLADADFFWNTDRKTSLHNELHKLKTVVFQNKLGSVYDKTQRVASLSEALAKILGADATLCRRAAELSKCDLMTEMVGEFPDLQGIMGRYYALHDKENPLVAEAVLEHYQPRFAGDAVPPSTIGQVISISDKIDTLVGIFSIGQIPTGDKDPFALRRAALGVVRIIVEKQLPVDLAELLTTASKNFKTNTSDTSDAVFDFMMDRLKGYYLELGFRPQVFEAVSATKPTSPADFDSRIKSVALFENEDAAESLAAANKRISNILKKHTDPIPDKINAQLFELSQETELHNQLSALQNDFDTYANVKNYGAALKLLSQLKEPIDSFFDNVMVMADNKNIRDNRLALLSSLYKQFARIADISRL